MIPIDTVHDERGLVVYLADRPVSSDSEFTPQQALAAAEEYSRDEKNELTGLLVLTVKSVKNKAGSRYATNFFQSGMSALEMAQLCRIMELRFMNMLGTVRTELEEVVYEAIQEEGPVK